LSYADTGFIKKVKKKDKGRYAFSVFYDKLLGYNIYFWKALNIEYKIEIKKEDDKIIL
jgi:hypothetical protein